MPKTITIHDRIIRALEARGEKKVTSKTRKATVYTRTVTRVPGKKVREGMLYFIGPSGSLRYGINYSSSTPVPDKLKTEILAEADALI